MDTPFPAGGQNPFPSPYQGLGAPAAPNPFLSSSLSNAFTGRKPTSDAASALPGTHAASGRPLPLGQPLDFSPAPALSLPVAARQSQILALSSLDPAPKPAFFLTTTSTMEGHAIGEYLGLISIEVVLPKDVLFRNPAPHGDLHRLKSAEVQLQKVKATALEELAGRAKGLGADGVVGVSLQFSQFDAGVCLCSAVGTAVKLAE